MNTPEHWQRNPHHPDRDSRVRKAQREMAIVALDRTPRWWILRRWRLRRAFQHAAPAGR